MTRAGAVVMWLGVFGVGCVPVADEPAVESPPQPAFAYVAPSPHAASSPAPAGWYQVGRASYYSDRLAGHRTASGERYDPGALTAAHRTLPIGALVDVVRSDGRWVRVRINDRGPYSHGRIIDLSKRAAAELGMVRDGVGDVALRVVAVP
jgi:rare lipoprotein A